MSLNDKSMLEGAKGEDVRDGVRNFTESSNPVTEELAQNANRYDAWAAKGDRGHQDGKPGVIESEAGLVESSNIAPLTNDSGAATGSAGATSTLDSIVGAAKEAYGAATGNADIENAGKAQQGN